MAGGCIAIDLGGTNLRLALVRDDGAIVDRDRWPTEINQGRAHLLDRLLSGITLLRERGAASGIDVTALGMGVPGLISPTGLILSSVNLQPIEGVNLQEVMAATTGLPTVVANDANAAAFGELRFGAGRPFTSLLMLTLGTGVGSGLVLDGKLWSGIDGVAAEFGHATIEPDGFPCRCGNRGCLEQYASATALERAAESAVRQGKEFSPGLTGDRLTAESVASAARSGDLLAQSLFEELGRYLGIAAATAVNLLNLEAIIIGGGVAASFDLFLDAMRRELKGRAFPLPAKRVTVLQSELGDNAGILGAAALAREVTGTDAGRLP